MKSLKLIKHSENDLNSSSDIENRHILIQKQVKSLSSENIYNVTICNNCVMCDCPAGGKKILCKHIIEVFNENADIIKEKSPVFYNDMLQLISIKKDKNHNSDDLKKISDKLILTNKYIAQKSAENTSVLNKAQSTEKEQKEILINKIIENINKIDIHYQFDFFQLLCFGYNKKNIGFRYTELPKSLLPFIDLKYLVLCDSPNTMFRKMDKGRKSIYFLVFSNFIQENLKSLHKKLLVRFPKIGIVDKDGMYCEQRVISPEYLDKEGIQQ